MPKRATEVPLDVYVRPWRDRRLQVLLSHIQGLRRCRAMGPVVLDHPKAKALRDHFPWGWPDTIGLLVLLTFAALLLRSILRW